MDLFYLKVCLENNLTGRGSVFMKTLCETLKLSIIISNLDVSENFIFRNNENHMCSNVVCVLYYNKA